MNHARLHLSQSKRKKTLDDEHVVELEPHSLLGVFQSSIGISHKGLRNFLVLDGIGIKAILHLGLIHRPFEIVHQRFLLKLGGGRKRDKNTIVFWLLVRNEGFHQPLRDHMVQCIGLVRNADGPYGRRRSSWEGFHCV
ncbi:hypothetical protein NPIL_110401 [Nephila pilipes]|uniref:Uncharacterized protein n=1 Tax=Nephila pilipes TaxID=299642 RepID=A0A8X6TH20_NEPPI|nr:hypothetical protein NPIL_110401 [Nephila pilipes]